MTELVPNGSELCTHGEELHVPCDKCHSEQRPSKDLLPDAKVTPEQEARATAMAATMQMSYWGLRSAACVIVRLQDEVERLDRVERELADADAQRWRAYLKFYDREEMVAAEWDGPAAITAFIDSMRAAQPPGDSWDANGSPVGGQ